MVHDGATTYPQPNMSLSEGEKRPTYTCKLTLLI